MKEYPIRDKVFPFDCINPDCQKEHSENDFRTTAFTWGYIFLTNGEHDFIGLTCPSCGKTTINKYAAGTTGGFTEGMGSDFRHFIPFIPDESLNLKIEKSEKLYHVPKSISLLAFTVPGLVADSTRPYPQWFIDSCLSDFNEEDFEKIIEFENTENKQLLPRIICGFSIYNKTEEFLLFLKGENTVIDDIEDGMNPVNLYQQIINIAEDRYIEGTDTTITEDEYKDFTAQYTPGYDYDSDTIKIITSLVLEYLSIRSSIDFVLKYKTNFLDKYMMELFYNEGYYDTEKRVHDKRDYEEKYGKQFPNNFPILPYSEKILSHTELMERWGIDINVIKALVVGMELPAYFPSRFYYDPSKNKHTDFNPADFVYSKSDVEELEMVTPWLNKQNDIEIADVEKSMINEKKIKNAIYEEGNSWRIFFNGRAIGSFTQKGFKFIKYLVKHSGKEINIYELDSLDGVHVEDVCTEVLITKGLNTGFGIVGYEEKQYIGDNKNLAVCFSHTGLLKRKLRDECLTLTEREEIEKKENDMQKYIGKMLRREGDKAIKKYFNTVSKPIQDKIGHAIQYAFNVLEKEDKKLFDHFKNAFGKVYRFNLRYKPLEKIKWDIR